MFNFLPKDSYQNFFDMAVNSEALVVKVHEFMIRKTRVVIVCKQHSQESLLSLSTFSFLGVSSIHLIIARAVIWHLHGSFSLAKYKCSGLKISGFQGGYKGGQGQHSLGYPFASSAYKNKCVCIAGWSLGCKHSKFSESATENFEFFLKSYKKFKFELAASPSLIPTLVCWFTFGGRSGDFEQEVNQNEKRFFGITFGENIL